MKQVFVPNQTDCCCKREKEPSFIPSCLQVISKIQYQTFGRQTWNELASNFHVSEVLGMLAVAFSLWHVIRRSRHAISMPRCCKGLDGVACVFSTSSPGQPAQPAHGSSTCIFCNLALLEERTASAEGEQEVIQRLAVPWQKILRRRFRSLLQNVFLLSLVSARCSISAKHSCSNSL